ncbi:MAG: LysR family transcriptional regulator [Aquabacterium sp.]|uniref:LysR family transcriptional regulator n=1 Tax=Aquabacterium sp. TaxID=1872578 RepID=UPI0025B8FC05|nr:LysR family transcriptional regulator [Aquabacterium sp.]MBI3381187.1 LysR family transcriptional regulator [Aquabacterium sp.]
MLSTDVLYFIEVARASGIGRAAEALGLSQPALSKAIARLERQSGTQLFTRLPRGMALTDAGRALYERACLAAANLEDGLQAARDIGGGHAGLLRLGMTPATSHFVLGALFPRLRRERPAAVLKITTAFGDELFARLRQQELSFAVGPVPPNPPDDLAQEVLYEEGFALVYSQDHPLAAQKDVTAADLEGLDVAAPGPEEPARQVAEKALRALGLRSPRVVVEADTLEALLFATATSRLVTLIPTSTPLHNLPHGLVMKPLPGSILQRQIAIFMGRGYVSPLADRAIQLLREHRQEMAATMSDQ